MNFPGSGSTLQILSPELSLGRVKEMPPRSMESCRFLGSGPLWDESHRPASGDYTQLPTQRDDLAMCVSRDETKRELHMELQFELEKIITKMNATSDEVERKVRDNFIFT